MFCDVVDLHLAIRENALMRSSETVNSYTHGSYLIETIRPISILLLILKFFEKVKFDQLCNYMNNFLNSLFCGFSKTRSAHYALFK